MAKSANQILDEKDVVWGDRRNTETLWQTVHDFFDNVGDDINTQYFPGTELTVQQLYDTNCLETADILGAGLMNHLTPPASRWFALRTSNPLQMEKKPILRYLRDVEAEVIHTFNNSNFYDVKADFFKKSGVYGTVVLFQEEDFQDKVRFYVVPLKSMGIREDARGRVVEYYIEFEYTATQAVTRFGPDKVHPEVLKRHLHPSSQDEKHKYTLYIGPNWERNPQAMDSGNKMWISQWIDDEHRTEIKRGGFDEMPSMTFRFYRRSYMPWGFSPAMKALMDCRMLNAKAKTQLRAAMKSIDPPIAMPNDSFMLPENFNPRGKNFYQKGAITRDDIFPIGNYGNYAVGAEDIQYSIDRLRSQMFTDVFLAFQGITKDMNNPEIFERIAEKMTVLGPSVGRYNSQVLNPTIQRTIGLLERQGRLPDRPPELLEDPNYEIEFVSRLSLAQRNGELQSLQNALGLAGQMAQFDPNVLDRIDADKAVDAVWGITGAPVQMLRDDDEVSDIRDARAQAQAEQQRLDMLTAGSDIAVKATQASKNSREAENVG